ncbi:MAG: Xaa-Pro aminopeptidase [Pseudomonadota bacterium]
MISATEFKQRRHALMGRMDGNSIAIIPSANEVMRNSDVDYPFRQDSDFYYLTGFDEPEAVLVLIPGSEVAETLLFCRAKDQKMELWNGYRCGPDDAPTRYGVDDAFPIDDINEILPSLLEGRAKTYYAIGRNKILDESIAGWVNDLRGRARSGVQIPTDFSDLNHHLHDLRLFKSAAEQAIMRQAGEISARAHCRAMQLCEPGMYEYQLEADILHEFHQSGARLPAYNSIVGSGDNACVLHYVENRRKMEAGDLVLIDAGCELEYYAADITRTFPVNGVFTQEQAALYRIVLEAQKAAIASVKAGAHWNVVHDTTVDVIVDGLMELKLLKGSREEIIEKRRYSDFYMHRAGHWLGMDVHDVGAYRIDDHWRCLEPGMTFTVEPGIYVSPSNSDVDARWRGIGIRIEDNVLVTKSGCDVMTDGVPKEIDDIQRLMAG